MCGGWAWPYSGSCWHVTCTSGITGGMNCINQKPTYVRVIDQLGNACSPGSGAGNHVFDLNDVAFSQLGADGGGCSGEFNINYNSVDCVAAGIVVVEQRSEWQLVNVHHGALPSILTTLEILELYTVLLFPLTEEIAGIHSLMILVLDLVGPVQLVQELTLETH